MRIATFSFRFVSFRTKILWFENGKWRCHERIVCRHHLALALIRCWLNGGGPLRRSIYSIFTYILIVLWLLNAEHVVDIPNSVYLFVLTKVCAVVDIHIRSMDWLRFGEWDLLRHCQLRFGFHDETEKKNVFQLLEMISPDIPFPVILAFHSPSTEFKSIKLCRAELIANHADDAKWLRFESMNDWKSLGEQWASFNRIRCRNPWTR